MTSYQVIYNGVNITENLSKEIEYIRFTDNLRGNADDIELLINNYDGKWYGPFKPIKGDVIELQIGDLLCGAFQVDAINYSLLPKTVTIQAQSAKTLRQNVTTKLNRAYQDTSFYAVVRDIAALLKLTPELYCQDVPVTQALYPNISIGGIMNSLCNRYGYTWKITNRTGVYGETIKDKLVVVDENQLYGTDPVFTLEWGKSTVVPGSINIEDVSRSVLKKTVIYLNPESYELTKLTTEDDNDLITSDMPEDTEVFTGPQPKLALSRSSKKIFLQEKLRGSLQMKGTPSAVAGVIFQFEGWDYPNNNFIDGRAFMITKATHVYDVQSGWTVDIEFVHNKKLSS
jgi:phage protein D